MKKLFATLALAAMSLSAWADFGVVDIQGPQFAPAAVGTISTEPGFDDNFSRSIGGLAALFNGQPVVLFETQPVGLTPPADTFYLAAAVPAAFSAQLGALFAYAMPQVVDPVSSAALQLAVWRITAPNVEVVDNFPTLDSAEDLASQFLAGAAGFGQVADISFYTSKPYATYVALSPIPEPSTALLAAAGMIGILLYRRRVQKK